MRHLFPAFVIALVGCSGAVGEAGTPGGAGRTGGISGQAPRPGGSGPQVTAPGLKPGNVVPTSLVRRLSQAELDNTIEDILGDVSRPAQKFFVEDEFKPYDNNYPVQAASKSYTDNLREMARDVARRAVADTKNRGAFIPCQPTDPGDAACFRKTIEKLGRRMLRRPLASAEVDAYMPLQLFATENNPTVPHDFYTAVELALRAFLQDPEFFNRVEIGRQTATAGVYALGSFEIATRMSYLLWGSTPDDALLTVADQDGLVSAAGRGTAFDRMQGGARARSQVQRFHSLWLGYRAIPQPADIAALFNAETTKLLDTVIFDAPSAYFDVFTSPRTYLTTALAAIYGLPAPPGGAGWVTYGPTSSRAGILSHGTVLASFSKFSDTSPTQRGILVQTRLMCNIILSPPATVNVDQPPGNPDQDCKIPRYQAHMGQSGCTGCHSQMDPIGFGLENYDMSGRVRKTDNGKLQCAIPGQGNIAGIGAFSGPKELAEKLLGANEIQDCLVRQYLTFALGRTLAAQEDTLVDALRKSMAAGGNRLVAMLRALVTDPSFGLRTLPEVP